MTNLAEYIAGTDPANKLSYLKVENLEGAAIGVNLSFLAMANRTYSVQYRTTLATGTWQVLTNLPARSANRLERVASSRG